MSLGEFDHLLDLIYEAAAIPDRWPAVLDRMAEIAGGVGTFLITADPRTIRWTSSGALRELGLDILEGHWHERNTRMDKLMLHRHSGFMRDVDMWTLEEMDQDPSFRGLLRPRGFGWCGGFLVQVPSDDMLLFSAERRFVDGPIESSAVSQLNALRLARAAMMSARLRLERAQGMAESLTTMGLPSAVLLGNGKICATNTQFERIGPQIISGAFGGVALANSGANALLSQAIESLNSAESRISAKSIAVPSDGVNAAFVIHVIPVRRSAHDVFGPAMGILVVMPLGSSETLSEDLLNGLFDLSPGEIRAANGLVQGKTIEGLAATFGLSRETIRTQVKAVLAKTGTARQTDLVSLLANVNMPHWHRAR